MGILITILLLCLVFKTCGLIFRLCGKVFGAAIGFVGFLLIGILAVVGFGLAFVALPIVLIVGVGAIIGLIVKAV